MHCAKQMLRGKIARAARRCMTVAWSLSSHLSPPPLRLPHHFASNVCFSYFDDGARHFWWISSATNVAYRLLLEINGLVIHDGVSLKGELCIITSSCCRNSIIAVSRISYSRGWINYARFDGASSTELTISGVDVLRSLVGRNISHCSYSSSFTQFRQAHCSYQNNWSPLLKVIQ